MKRNTGLFAGTLVAFFFALGVYGQDVPVPPSASPASGTQSDAGSLDMQGVRGYLLGPGDIISVKVFGEPQLDGDLEVRDDGNIEFPFIEKPILALCRTDHAIRDDIVLGLSRLIRDPQVSVRIKERRSRPPAVVFGAVRVPQRIQMQRRVRLLDILAFSGGVVKEQAGSTVMVKHTEPLLCTEGPTEPAPSTPSVASPTPAVAPVTPAVTSPTPDVAPATPAVASATPAVVPVTPAGAPAASPAMPAVVPTPSDDDFAVYDLNDLAAGVPAANPYINPGDIIIIPEAPPIYITGSVVAPQGVRLREHLSLTQALAMVGGVRREAKKREITIRRLRPNSSDREAILVNFEAIQKQQVKDIELQPYDIVEVGQAGAFSGERIGDTMLGLVTGGLSTGISAVASLPVRVLY